MPGIILTSPVKINLTLRILERRQDGFHNLCSSFFRLPIYETLTVSPFFADISGKDKLAIHGEKVEGKNILFDVLSIARKKGAQIPPLEMELTKLFPPRSGTGAGSGNAAALWKWIENTWPLKTGYGDPAVLGSDIPFLLSGERLSIRGGKGEVVLDKSVPLTRKFAIIVLIPNFESDTSRAYALLDKKRDFDFERKKVEESVSEAKELLNSIENGRLVGFLPNDFAQILIGEHPEYGQVFKEFERYGAICWGITGSGSGCFAFFDKIAAACSVARNARDFCWARKIFVLE